VTRKLFGVPLCVFRAALTGLRAFSAWKIVLPPLALSEGGILVPQS
jgi:hypothetical protein